MPQRNLRDFHRCDFRKFAKVAIPDLLYMPVLQHFRIGTAIALARECDAPADYSGGGNCKESEDVWELSYGTDNRKAKPAFIGQVYANTGANHQH
jgi:hypothetical protein